MSKNSCRPRLFQTTVCIVCIVCSSIVRRMQYDRLSQQQLLSFFLFNLFNSNISFRASCVQKTVGLFQIQSINQFTWKQKRTQVPVSNTVFYSRCSPIRYSHAIYGARCVISVSQRGSRHVDWAGWMGVHWRNKSCRPTTAAISDGEEWAESKWVLFDSRFTLSLKSGGGNYPQI